MRDGFAGGMFVGALLISIAWYLLLMFVMSQIGNSWREQIVEHKAAHYYLDQNNQRQWDWTQ